MIFWKPLFGGLGGVLVPTVTKKYPKRKPKGMQKRENSDSAEPWFLDDPTVVLLHSRVLGSPEAHFLLAFFGTSLGKGSGEALFRIFRDFWHLWIWACLSLGWLSKFKEVKAC